MEEKILFCPECGTKIVSDDVCFCSECGTKLKAAPEPLPNPPLKGRASRDANNSSAPSPSGVEPLPNPPLKGRASRDANNSSAPSPSGEGWGEASWSRGLLLTNVALLAAKLGVDAATVADVLQQFIAAKRDAGVDYHLVDAGGYTYRRSGIFSRTRTVRLDADSDVWDYMDILRDAAATHGVDATVAGAFLFIIGGDDIIPQPCVRHYIADDDHDDSIDTDLLYAYPYGEEALTQLEDQTLFARDPLFTVGRLPLAADAVVADLTDYLARAVAASSRLVVDSAYGQCDPHWKNVSARATADLADRGLLRAPAVSLDASSCYRSLVLSPDVCAADVARVLPRRVSLYYFNLHGGNGRETRGYYGVPMGAQQAVSVILPEHLHACTAPNVIVSEACYGGRFIGLDKRHSMMLSALAGGTLLFVGSSRVAWGAVDGQATTPASAGQLHADVMASTFIREMLAAAPAGYAFRAAQAATLHAVAPGDLHAALTVVEFNLYGDPSLWLSGQGAGGKAGRIEAHPYTSDTQGATGCKAFRVDDGQCGEPTSLLADVRRRVDDNIQHIHKTLAQYLYEQYGLPARPVDAVFRLRYADGREELRFDYDYADKGSAASIRIAVITDGQGSVRHVLASRGAHTPPKSPRKHLFINL